jgi:hypothetical protein
MESKGKKRGIDRMINMKAQEYTKGSSPQEEYQNGTECKGSTKDNE